MKLMIVIHISRKWGYADCALFLCLAAINHWILNASRRLSGIKINHKSRLLGFMGNASLIVVSSTQMIKLYNTWKSLLSHLKSWTVLLDRFLLVRLNQIRTIDGLVFHMMSSQKSVKLLTKSKVWPSVQSCHESWKIQHSTKYSIFIP